MKFTVKSGKHIKSLDAMDFNQAVSLFLKILLEENEHPKLGGIIEVTCQSNAYFDTDDSLKNLRLDENLRLYEG